VGTYSITFPSGDAIAAQVLGAYQVSQTVSSYRAISGVNLNLDDDAVALVTAPFPIPFGGGRFSGVFVSANGNASFTSGLTTSANVALPSLQIPSLVAPWWDDLFPVAGTAQNVFWDVLGSAPNRELVVEWRDVPVSGCQSSATATIKFQIVFFESSDNVLFNYADTSVGGACARPTCARHGRRQTSTQSAVQFSFNTQSLSNGLPSLSTLAADLQRSRRPAKLRQRRARQLRRLDLHRAEHRQRRVLSAPRPRAVRFRLSRAAPILWRPARASGDRALRARRGGNLERQRPTPAAGSNRAVIGSGVACLRPPRRRSRRRRYRAARST
jgi:hypothetical protein